MTAYLVLLYPFKQKLKLVQFFIQEIIIFIVNICVLATVISDQSSTPDSTTKNNAGSVIIYCNVVFRLLAPVLVFLQLTSIVKTAFDDWKKKKQQKLDVAKPSVDENLRLDNRKSILVPRGHLNKRISNTSKVTFAVSKKRRSVGYTAN